MATGRIGRGYSRSSRATPLRYCGGRMQSRFLAVIATLLLYFGFGHAASAVQTAVVAAVREISMFDTETAAKGHCPSDEVVWLNTHSGIYHEKGMRWYGHTKQGAYVCRKEADAAGYRDTRNGQ
jgi:hypothetical protein